MSESSWKTDLSLLIPFFIENSSQPFATADPYGRITFINRACCDTLGYTEAELLSMDWSKDLTPAGWSVIESSKLRELHTSGEPVRYEKEYLHKKGHHVPVELLVHLIRDDSGEPVYYYTFITDLTERKLAEKQLNDALLEKEILMKELQHRVKNNLNIIAGLIDIEMDKLADQNTRAVFLNARSRIQSISVIYEQLYKAGTIDSVDLHDYISNLTKSFKETYLIEQSGISIQLDLEHLILDLRRAVPLGLIINELITNSIKYAFPADRAGVINITLATADDMLLLTISDNGIGLPCGFTLEKNSSMGLTLAEMLCKQLNGIFEIKSDSGTVIKISFKI